MRWLVLPLLVPPLLAQEAPPAPPPASGTLLSLRADWVGACGVVPAGEARQLLEPLGVTGGARWTLPVHGAGALSIAVDLGPGVDLQRRPDAAPVERRIETSLETTTRQISERRDGELSLASENATQLGRREIVQVVDQGDDAGFRRRIDVVSHELELRGTRVIQPGVHRATGARLNEDLRRGRNEDGSLAPRPLDGAEPFPDRHHVMPAGHCADDPELLGLLPGRPVAVGERWSLSPDAVRAALLPVGDVEVVYLSPEHDLGWYPTLHRVLAGDAEGENSARLAGVRHEAGRRLAVVELDLALEVVTDMTSHFGSHPPTDGSSGYRTRHVDSDWLFEGAGELRWDLDAGRAVVLTIEGALTQRYDFHYLLGEEDHEFRQEVNGRLEVRLMERIPPRPEEPPAPPVVDPDDETEREDDR